MVQISGTSPSRRQRCPLCGAGQLGEMRRKRTLGIGSAPLNKRNASTPPENRHPGAGHRAAAAIRAVRSSSVSSGKCAISGLPTGEVTAPFAANANHQIATSDRRRIDEAIGRRQRLGRIFADLHPAGPKPSKVLPRDRPRVGGSYRRTSLRTSVISSACATAAPAPPARIERRDSVPRRPTCAESLRQIPSDPYCGPGDVMTESPYSRRRSRIQDRLVEVLR